jgi:GH25 family lysozyme M1 (1,4-beta-N-acetylmuramidase)
MKGIDLSHWNPNWRPAESEAAGAKFAILRAGSINDVTGIPYRDNLIDEHYARGNPSGLKLGYYWYMRPQHNPEGQADFFWNIVKDFRRDLPLWCDIEKSGGLNPAKVTASVLLFCRRLAQHAPVGIYTRATFSNSFMFPDPALATFPLWVARYTPTLNHPWGDVGTFRPRPWRNWLLWQWSADTNFRGWEFGVDSPQIDLNIWNEEFPL